MPKWSHHYIKISLDYISATNYGYNVTNDLLFFESVAFTIFSQYMSSIKG